MTVTLSVTNFAWSSSYVLSVPLGGAPVDPREDAIFHPFPTVICFMMLPLLRRVA